MAYTAQITRANPTLIVFLLDQSGSMADPFGGEQSARKADFVASTVNHALHDLVIRCTKTEEVRDYYHVAVVGYGRQVGVGLGGALSGLTVAPVSAVADNPARIESGYRRVPDGAGGFVEMPVRFPVWVHPQAEGGTPMCRALGRVREIIEGWLGAHPERDLIVRRYLKKQARLYFPALAQGRVPGRGVDAQGRLRAHALPHQ